MRLVARAMARAFWWTDLKPVANRFRSVDLDSLHAFSRDVRRVCMHINS